MTFLAEHSPEGKRGLITSYAQIASFLALLTGTLVAFAMSPWLNEAAINGGGPASWAWRVPFLVAIPMGIIGWYIRRAISDTPNFEKLKAEGGLSRNPLKEAFATPEHRKAMLLALFIPLMNGSGYYVLFSYMPTFLKGDNDRLLDRHRPARDRGESSWRSASPSRSWVLCPTASAARR